jgi:hypothetical protein
VSLVFSCWSFLVLVVCVVVVPVLTASVPLVIADTVGDVVRLVGEVDATAV